MIYSAIFGIIAVIVGGLLLPRARWLTAALFMVLLLSVASTGLSALGSPIPLALARYWLPEKITVAGFQFREGVAIDILVGGPSPLLVSLPWSEGKAQKLQDGDREAKAKHAGLKASVKGLLGGDESIVEAIGKALRKVFGKGSDLRPSSEGPVVFPEAPPPGEAKTGD